MRFLLPALSECPVLSCRSMPGPLLNKPNGNRWLKLLGNFGNGIPAVEMISECWCNQYQIGCCTYMMYIGIQCKYEGCSLLFAETGSLRLTHQSTLVESAKENQIDGLEQSTMGLAENVCSHHRIQLNPVQTLRAGLQSTSNMFVLLA